jgi:hypothetical protein
LAIAAFLGMPHSAFAQQSQPADTLQQAGRLRDQQDYAAAAAILVPYAAAHPDDTDTALFAATMAYWSKDIGSARAIYEQQLIRHGNTADLRVAYARFLMDLGETSRARAVITPLVETGSRVIPATRRALTVLGTLDYWDGDYSSAKKRFVETLRLDSTDADARRQLREIATAAASWMAVGASALDDDQPLRRYAGDLEAGWFATPLTPLSIRTSATSFDHDAGAESLGTLDAGVATYFPSAHIDVAARGGVIPGSFDEHTDWTGRFALGVRLPRAIRLEAVVQRASYTNTVRSLTRAIMTEAVEGRAHWGVPGGWMAEIVGRRESFPDDNHVVTGYGWLLAPVMSRSTGALHFGYAFSSQSADENRFVPAGDVQLSPAQAPTTVTGVYDPYYTPRTLRVHSALANGHLTPNARWSVDASARVAVSAHDEAPVLIASATPPTTTVSRGFYERSFTPWNASASIDWAATRTIRIGVGAEHGREAYYSFTTVRLRFTSTFIAAAERRAGLR